MGWQIIQLICISEKQKYFCLGGLTEVLQNNPIEAGQELGFFES
jgi:hypothetical protein